MYCIHCGKQNPDDALYCAWCGTELPRLSDSDPHGSQEPPAADPAAGTASAASAAIGGIPPLAEDWDAAFRRPAHGKTVQPRGENPAQPDRKEKPPVEAVEETSADASGARQRRIRAQALAENAEEAAEPEPSTDRRTPVRPRSSAGSRERSARTIVPRKRTENLFFDEKDESEDLYDEMVDRSDARHSLRSAILAVLLLGVLIFAFWLLVLPGSGKFRARIGMQAPEEAWIDLGDEYTQQGLLNRASDAYYRAFSMDPENYELAMLTAKTCANAGDVDKAIEIYSYCIRLNETASAPYEAIASLYLQKGDAARALEVLSIGYERTDALSLYRAKIRLESRSGGTDG